MTANTHMLSAEAGDREDLGVCAGGGEGRFAGTADQNLGDSPDAGRGRGLADGTNIPGLLLICLTFLMFVCFDFPGRDDIVASIDTVAMLKLVTRLGAFGLLGFMILCSRPRERILAVAYVLLPLALFVLWGITSVLWSPWKTVSLGQISVQVVLLMAAAVIGLRWKGPLDTRLLLASISCALLSISCLLVFLYYVFPEYGALHRFNWGVVHPTAAGAISGMGILILVASWLLWQWRWSRWLLIPGLIAHTWLLILSNNRAATGIVAILVCGLLVLFGRKKLLLSLAVAGCVCVAAYLPFDPGAQAADSMISTTTEHMLRGQKPEDIQEVSGRKEMWTAMYKSWMDSKWIGHGYFICSPTGEMFVWGTTGPRTAHNMVLQILVGTGVVGLGLFVFGVATVGIAFSRTDATPHTRRLLCFAVTCGLWYLLWGLVNESVAGPMAPESVVFYVVLGLLVGATTSATVREFRAESREMASTFAQRGAWQPGVLVSAKLLRLSQIWQPSGSSSWSEAQPR